MYLLKNFLADSRQYAKAEKLWAQTWSMLIKQLGQERRWKVPWFEPKFGNGEPMADGNPIFTAVDRSRRMTVRVIQIPVETERETDFTFWTDTFGKGDPEELDELVIACVLSDQTLAQATDLMTRWAAHGSLKGTVRRARTARAPRTPIAHRHGMPRA
jgi:hypothetical protein